MVTRTRFLMTASGVHDLRKQLRKIQEDDPFPPPTHRIFYVLTYYWLKEGWLVGVANGAGYYWDPYPPNTRP